MKTVELFSGAGGLGIGLRNAGFEAAKVVEWDRDCCDTIRGNQRRNNAYVRGWPLVHGDVRAVDFSEYRGKVQLVSGGPPCQPFSLGGKHQAYRDDRDMFPQAIRAVREIAPKAFVFENVKGLTRASFRNYFEYIKLQLTHPEVSRRPEESWESHHARLERHHVSGSHLGLRYNVVSRVLNAADYGVPQRRERVFIVGFREDVGVEWCFPNATHSGDALLWDQRIGGEYWDRHHISRRNAIPEGSPEDDIRGLGERPQLKPWRTVRDAICDLPDPEADPEGSLRFHNHRFQPGARAYPGHTGSPLDQPAKTLKAGDHGVPGGENMLRKPSGEVRYFTVRESARLQTFPDSYRFHGCWTEAMRQIGNAVPVTLATVVGNAVRSRLEALGTNSLSA
jgi:DNA (cytosine-5)-methyltransferase 1